ncbi:Rieske (2Fe-2S) protein [Saccharopolyspora shandongensis]|uniref:Rieske (2Fe-2S) protein n=1 Tax=Saccharopolyspora shandongensis TaxID=418495 RepID=UPI0033E63EA9
MTVEKHTRRTVLTAGGAVAGAAAGAAALAACGSGTGPQAPQPSPAEPGTDAAVSPPGQPLAALSAVPVGEAVALTTQQGQPVIVSRPSDDTVVGFDGKCTHKGCAVAPQGAELRCPCHGSVFDAFTGAVKQGPAKTPLPKLEVKVENDQIISG